MVTNRCLIAALLVATSIPAGASVVVVGSNSARMCYLAADAASPPLRGDFQHCAVALDEEGLTRRDRAATYVNRGILRLRREMTVEAIADFDSALAIDPNQPEASLNKGAALLRQNRAEAALPLFTAALEHRTYRPALAYLGRGMANERLGDARAAYSDYRMASQIEPHWSAPRTELQRFRVVSR
jgi:tetratricopeptide (TPR) repeat protein